MKENKNTGRNKKGQFVKDNKIAEKWTEKEAMRFVDELENWMLLEDENIFYDEFIYLLKHDYRGKIRGNTVSYLSEKFPPFCERMKKIEKIQETKLKKFGAFDKLNANITKFILNVEHGMIETREVKQEVTNTQQTPTMIVFSKTDKEDE